MEGKRENEREEGNWRGKGRRRFWWRRVVQDRDTPVTVIAKMPSHAFHLSCSSRQEIWRALEYWSNLHYYHYGVRTSTAAQRYYYRALQSKSSSLQVCTVGNRSNLAVTRYKRSINACSERELDWTSIHCCDIKRVDGNYVTEAFAISSPTSYWCQGAKTQMDVRGRGYGYGKNAKTGSKRGRSDRGEK